MTDDLKPIEEYTATYDTFSPRLLKATVEKSRDLTDSFLMMFGTPDNYQGHRAIVQTSCEALLAWLVVEGYVTLNPEWVITDEESAEREVERAARKAARPERPEFPLGGYA